MARTIDISEPLQRLLLDLDITQDDFARAAEVSTGTANRWANGRNRVDPRKFAKAIENLGATPEDYGVPGSIRRIPAGPPPPSALDSPPAWFTQEMARLHAAIAANGAKLDKIIAFQEMESHL